MAVTRTTTQPISCKNIGAPPSMNTLITHTKAEKEGDSYNKSRKPINPLLGPH